jgi:transposase
MPQLAKNATLKWPGELPGAKAQGQRKSKGGRAARSRAVKRDPTEGLQVANPNAAAIDIGCAEHWVSVPPGRVEVATQCFGCSTAELNRLADWLEECGVDTVVMEATGNYWVVLYDLLEERRLNPVVVNPRYAKNMSGKKGDIPDCQWMQKLHTYGLFANSFRPAPEIRVLRAYLRQRESLVGAASEQIKHMQRSLTEMNVQLANVISDISGETGLAIIDAILRGERNARALAELKGPRIQASLVSLERALEGHWKDEELFRLEQARLTYAHFQEQILQCQERIERQMQAIQGRVEAAHPVLCPGGLEVEAAGKGTKAADGPVAARSPQSFDLSAQLKRILGVDLTQIDGIGPVAAQVILSEIGSDMSRWPTEKHFSSWLGLCPDHRISGGKVLGRSTRPVVSRARNALRLCAYTLTHSKSWLGAKYRRLKAKLGAPKAIVAMAHHLARLIYRMIKNGADYVDKGMGAYEARYRAQRLAWLKKQAKDLNMEVVELKGVA